MSGLTVGLLSIDTLELEMKMIHGTDEQKKLAQNVLPMLHKHHYLLVTLLLNNAIAMEALPIFLDAIVPSAWAIAISVTLVLFFGEIIPQALCIGPQQLKIASFVSPYVNFLMIACGIITYPISRILDWLLGEHHAIRYTNNDLKALIELHSLAALQETLGHPGLHGFGLQAYQTKMIQGAIEIQQ
jgi:metal transporter CNNM